MATQSPSTEELVNLKHRLTGAIVLVLLAVIALPKVFSGATVQAPMIETELQDPGIDGEFVSRITPMQPVAEPVGNPGTANAGNDSENNTVAAVTPGANVVTGAGDETGEESQAPEGGAWIVRVGTFKETANASQIIQTLEDKGFQPQSAEVDTGVGKATRVWVGPYSKKVTASRILNRIEDEVGEKGFISAYP